MPYYEYKCPNCGVIELKANIKDTIPSSIPCPKCGCTADRKYSKDFTFTFSPYLRELKEGNMLDY